MNAEEYAALEAKIADMEQTYRDTEAKIGTLTGKAQDAAIRYLAGCGTELARLRARL
jgi:hypothetical protein